VKALIKAIVAVLLFASIAQPSSAECSDSADEKKIVNGARIVTLKDGDVWVAGDGVKRGFLGVQLSDMTGELREYFSAPRDAGLLISAVTADSPAGRAGLKVGDVLVSIDGTRATSNRAIEKVIRSKKEGERMDVEVVRDRAIRHLSATAAEREIRIMDLSGFHDFPMVIGDELKPGLEKMQTYFKSPEWKAKVESLQDCGAMQTRLKTLEQRLDQLEKKSGNK
jgi:membrane-associated protease RseP (regulator of RpoE activity)